MLEKTKQALLTNETTVKELREKFAKGKKELEAFKENERLARLTKLKTAYNMAVQESIKKTYEIIENDIESVKEDVKTFISIPADPGFKVALDALTLIKEPTKEEVDAIAHEYMNNYISYRAVCGAINKNPGITVNDINDVLNDILDTSYRALNDGIGTHRYETLKNENVFNNFVTLFDTFLKGDFEGAANKLNEMLNPY